MEKFREMVAAQGGNLDAKRPIAPASEVTAAKSGYVAAMNVEQLGFAIIELGGGRQKLGDKLDFSTGLEMLVRLGDKVEKGQPLVRLFAPRESLHRQQNGHRRHQHFRATDYSAATYCRTDCD